MKKTTNILLFSSFLVLSACMSTDTNQTDSAAGAAVPVPAAEQSKAEAEAYYQAEAKKRQHSEEAAMVLMAQPAPSTSADQFVMADATGAVVSEVDFQHAPVGTEKYPQEEDSNIKLVTSEPVSTFSIDVDTASYSNVRRMLNQGYIPNEQAVRIEEMINYFDYDYPQPENGPFAVYTEVGPSPFNEGKHLLHIGIQGQDVDVSERPASNLVFLIDVSGSMNNDNKIGLLKKSLKMLTRQMTENDRVSIVVYAGAAGVVLDPTAGNDQATIASALERLQAGGSTNGGAGIHLAYQLAEQNFIEGGINRVILATDGDFNVGTVNQHALKTLIEDKRESGVSLSVLGFGMGNYNDSLMQELAQNGNGNAYYIDSLNEARKVLVDELTATLMTIAKDVKIQLEFNPGVVKEYRLIGYETRHLDREDFNNDQVDAGEIGAGHTVTAIYELTLVGSNAGAMDDLRYQSEHPEQVRSQDFNNEIAFLRLRYKQPDGEVSTLIEAPIETSLIKKSLQQTSETYRFSAAVAGFGQLLRGGKYNSTMNMADIIALAKASKGDDEYGYRGEFLQMLRLAESILPQHDLEADVATQR